MASLSHRLSRDTRSLSSSGHRIYAPFYSKNAAATATFIDCYTPGTNSWRRATTIPGFSDSLVLKDFAMVALGHHIYVIGGRLCPAAEEQDSGAGDDQESVVAGVRRYDVRSDSWEICAAMSQPRFNFACSVNNNKIYVAGGQSTSGLAEGISSAEVYDPLLNQWRSLANMRMMRYNCVGVTWKGKVHVVGGFISGRPYVDVVARSSAEVYDEKRDTWVFVFRMWDLDIPPYQIVAVNDKLFSSGDRLKPWKGHIEMFDEKETIWNVVSGSHCHFLSHASMATTRLYLTMAPIENRLYFLSGYRIPGEDLHLRSEVHVFDTAVNGDGWQQFEPVEQEGEKELCGHCCVLKQEN